MTDATPQMTDDELRATAQHFWQEIARGLDDLGAVVQQPSRDYEGTVDPEFVASEIAQLNLRAAADHARTLGKMVRNADLGPSSATLARGALESLARIHWLADASSPEVLNARGLTMLREDVAKSAPSMEYSGGGRELNRQEYVAAIKAEISRIDQPDQDWALSRAVAAAVTVAWKDADGRYPYSQLSAVAHGQLPGVGSLKDPTTGLLRLPRQEVLNHVGIVFGVADRAVHNLQRCPLPLLPEAAVPEIWERITVGLWPSWRALAAEDRGEPRRRQQPGAR